MKLRLIKRDRKLLLLCADGSIATANDNVLRKLFVCFNTPEAFRGEDGRWKYGNTEIAAVDGTTVAYVNEENHLCLVENPFVSLMQNVVDDEYITLHEYAEIHQKNDNRIKALCREERIPGALKKAGKWFIPKHAPYPKDARFSGVEK